MGQNVEADIVIIFFMTIPRVDDNFELRSFSLGVNSQILFRPVWSVVSSGSDIPLSLLD